MEIVKKIAESANISSLKSLLVVDPASFYRKILCFSAYNSYLLPVKCYFHYHSKTLAHFISN